MKILFVSMPSIHFIRWIDNLKDQNWELYWFDVLDRGKIKTNIEIQQFTGWKHRKLSYMKGEYLLSKKAPFLHQKLRRLLEVTEAEQFEIILKEIRPDIVHSFEMQHCSYPLINTLSKKRYKNIKWVYSCWGSDLFFYKNFKNDKSKIQKALKHIGYLHVDNKRDLVLARELGYSNNLFGIIPGGSGYRISNFKSHKRKTILVKGYQHKFGRALFAIKAIEQIWNKLNVEGWDVIVFAAHSEVKEYIRNNKLPFKVFDRKELSHKQVLNYMNISSIYIGNSISDGIPNTLIEAIINEVFPIQSNPGNVTEELIKHKENGFLISNPESVEEIKHHIFAAIVDGNLRERARLLNKAIAKKSFDYFNIKSEIIKNYRRILK
ncbi:MAG: glycosyltransferase [Zunongwangia sp.]|uniref:glycosyltransferase n=1 Tax=Zunongwangia sp. TaxID=1965325 RepID=UPI003242DF83